MTKHLSALMLMAGASLAQAHIGHGLPGTAHWHAGDLLLLAGLALAAAAGLWLLRRDW